MSYFVGYGSLVNRKTHDYEVVSPTQLRGWRRMWRKTALRKAAYLTVVPDDDCEIDVLVAAVSPNDWSRLDQREAAYIKQPARHQIEITLPGQADVVVYAIQDGHHHPPDATSPVLLSYIDVVVQGYLHLFGEAGVTRFFETTGGWDAPIFNDRAQPVYSRHQRLNADETALVDRMLNEVSSCNI